MRRQGGSIQPYRRIHAPGKPVERRETGGVRRPQSCSTARSSTKQRSDMRIGGFVKQSLIDWEGVLSAVVFTKGCNFRCDYCHNPSLVLPSLTDHLPDLSETVILDYLRRRRGVDRRSRRNRRRADPAPRTDRLFWRESKDSDTGSGSIPTGRIRNYCPP